MKEVARDTNTPGIRAFRIDLSVLFPRHGSEEAARDGGELRREVAGGAAGGEGSQGATGSAEAPRRAQLSGSIAGPRGRAQAAPEGVPPTEAHFGAESVVGGNAWDESYEPWCDPRFSDHGRGRDSWCLALWERGWLMRLHPKARKNPFMPFQRTLPCLPEQLNGDRVTLIQHSSGDLEIISDEWQDPRPWTRSSEWKGVTYFRRARPERSNEDIAVIDGYEVIR